MSVIKAYSSNSAKVGINGVPLAGIELAEEYERHSEYPVLGFGDCVPFELQIGARLYGGCRCTELKKTKKPDGSEVQRIKIAALCCEEVSGDE